MGLASPPNSNGVIEMIVVRKINPDQFKVTTSYSQETVNTSELKQVRELKGKLGKVKKLKVDESICLS